MKRSRQSKLNRRQSSASLQFERLEERLALTADASGDVFWDANRNGLDDDPNILHESVAVDLTFGDSSSSQVVLSGARVGYTGFDIEDESLDEATGNGFEVASIDADPGSGYQLSSPLNNAAQSNRSYATLAGVPISKPSWVESADLDGTNGPDLIVANFAQAKLAIMLNDGAGGFSSRFEVPIPVNATSIATADFDADGDIDVAVGNFSADHLTLLINDGTGTFASSGSVRNEPAGGSGPFSVLAADLNADGKPDLVSSNFWDHTLTVYINESTPSQISFAAKTPIPAGSGSATVVAANLEGQPGLPSLLVLNTVINQLVIYDNDGNGGFSHSSENTIPAAGIKFVTAGQIDADAFDDIVMFSPSNQRVQVRFGDGQGGFVSESAAPQTRWFPRGVALADMDNDGDTDIVANLIDGNPPVILRNEGNRQISDTLPLFNAPLDAVVASPPALDDFNGDGVVDIAYSPAWLGGTIRVSLRRLGDGQQIVRTNEGNLTDRDFGVTRVVSPASTLAGDYDGSGTVDGLDLGVWEANFGRSAGPGMSADGNGSGRVEGSDFLLWQRNLGNVVATAEATVATTTVAATASQIDANLYRATVIDAIMATSNATNIALPTSGHHHLRPTETQLKDEVFRREPANDFRSTLWELGNDDFGEIGESHASSRSYKPHSRGTLHSSHAADKLLSAFEEARFTEWPETPSEDVNETGLINN